MLTLGLERREGGWGIGVGDKERLTFQGREWKEPIRWWREGGMRWERQSAGVVSRNPLTIYGFKGVWNGMLVVETGILRRIPPKLPNLSLLCCFFTYGISS